MKRYLILATAFLGLFLLNATGASSQFSLGAKVGVNSAAADIELAYGETYETSSRKGAIVGGILNMHLLGPLSLQFEPQYARKGYRLDDTFDSEPMTVIAKLDYIEIPVLLKGTWSTKKFSAFAFAGPSLGFRMAAQVSSVLPNSVETSNVEYSTKDIDLSLDFGGGVGFEVAPGTTLYTDGRISQGIINVDSQGDSYKSRDMKFSVGLLFELE